MTDKAPTRRYNLLKNWLGHDLETFSGRLQHWFKVVDPRNGQYASATLCAYKKDVDAYLARADGEGFADLTEAEFLDFQHKKLILTSCVHPDTQQVIPWPMRTSTFVQTNIPIMVGMLLSAPTVRNSIFWQWINQTYNAALNFGNRNASSTQSNTDLLKSYGLAVFTSISTVLLLKKLLFPLARGKSELAAQTINFFANWVAVAASSALNVTFVRSGELTTGISVTNPNDPNESLGMS